MPRYIDADKALIFIKKTNANYHWLLSQYSASWIYDYIESQPTADVVPRAEVANILDELMKEVNAIADLYAKRADEATDYVKIDYRAAQKGAILALLKISEFKKKYTKGDEGK